MEDSNFNHQFICKCESFYWSPMPIAAVDLILLQQLSLWCHFWIQKHNVKQQQQHTIQRMTLTKSTCGCFLAVKCFWVSDFNMNVLKILQVDLGPPTSTKWNPTFGKRILWKQIQYELNMSARTTKWSRHTVQPILPIRFMWKDAYTIHYTPIRLICLLKFNQQMVLHELQLHFNMINI